MLRRGAPDTFKSEPNADFSRSAKVMVSVLSLKLKVITILSLYKNTEFTKLFIKLLRVKLTELVKPI